MSEAVEVPHYVLYPAGAVEEVEHRHESIVLVHGFLQSSATWSFTAKGLQSQGYDVVAVDLSGHGATRCQSFRDVNPKHMVEDILKVLDVIEWSDRLLTLAGMSMGGAICLHFTLQFPERVKRLILVAGAGLSEPWYRPLGAPSHLIKPCLSSFLNVTESCGIGSVRMFQTLLGYLNVVRFTPQYQVPDNAIETLKKFPAVEICLVTGGNDEFHSAQKERWNKLNLKVHLHWPWYTHALMCAGVDRLQLHKYTELWSNISEKPIRAKL